MTQQPRVPLLDTDVMDLAPLYATIRSIWPLVAHRLPIVKWHLGKKWEYGSRYQVTPNCYQIFIKKLVGLSWLICVNKADSVNQMKHNIMLNVGYPAQMQNMIYGGKAL